MVGGRPRRCIPRRQARVNDTKLVAGSLNRATDPTTPTPIDPRLPPRALELGDVEGKQAGTLGIDGVTCVACRPMLRRLCMPRLAFIRRPGSPSPRRPFLAYLSASDSILDIS